MPYAIIFLISVEMLVSTGYGLHLNDSHFRACCCRRHYHQTPTDLNDIDCGHMRNGAPLSLIRGELFQRNFDRLLSILHCYGHHFLVHEKCLHAKEYYEVNSTRVYVYKMTSVTVRTQIHLPLVRPTSSSTDALPLHHLR